MATTNQTETDKSLRVGFYPGVLGPFQRSAFWAIRGIFGDEKTCHRVGLDYGSDLGRLMSSDPKIAQRVSKAKSEERVGKFKVSAEVSGFAQSSAMRLVRVAQVADDLVKEGLVTSEAFKIEHLNIELRSYWSSCQTWAKEQVWAGDPVKIETVVK